ncbi:hypothetical protein PanWU01x14_031680 [Parasponia andersonii]|uniref:Uncharacterized protein n=1 Tax=Parasponia andersonii TaxID=3476 RepID=A0A2P5DU76_PARAD|nr:hypothetical protein PanWU01x14_031680 [Parasponia andersonii]
MLKIVMRQVGPDQFHGEMFPGSALATENQSWFHGVTSGEQDIVRRRGWQHEFRLVPHFHLRPLAMLNKAKKGFVGDSPDFGALHRIFERGREKDRERAKRK